MARGIGEREACSDKGNKKLRYLRTADAYAAHEFLANDPRIDNKNIFQLGTGNGGAIGILISKPQFFGKPPKSKFTAVVSIYPWCGTLGANLISPLLVLHAENDDWDPPHECRNRFKAGFMAGAPYEYVEYSNTYHAFDIQQDLTYLGHELRYNSAATLDSQTRYVAFFKKHMVQ